MPPGHADAYAIFLESKAALKAAAQSGYVKRKKLAEYNIDILERVLHAIQKRNHQRPNKRAIHRMRLYHAPSTAV